MKNKKRKPDTFPNMTVYNDGSSGTMAVKELLESFDYKIEKIMEPLSSYKMAKKKSFFDNPGLLLIIEPQYYFKSKDVKILEEIAEKGFNIIIFSDYGSKVNSFVDASADVNSYSYILGNSKIYKDVSTDITSVVYDRTKKLSMLNNLYLNGKKRIVKQDKEWKQIIMDNEGILAIEKNIGEGKIVIVSESDFLSNWNIRKEDNALFAYQLISYYSGKFNDKIVYFEEYHHGFHKKFTFLYFIAKKEYSALILQVTLF
ncbi:MAG: hypothetical protein JXB50_10325, partial [Spirochaetes bacterium]|nr:hypothetical protein [Spirochaetota bacterium]